MLKEDDVLIELRFKKHDSYDEDIRDYISVGDNKYFYKSESRDYQYIKWYNGEWEFVLVDYTKDWNSRDDSLVFKGFKELRY